VGEAMEPGFGREQATLFEPDENTDFELGPFAKPFQGRTDYE